MSKYQLNPLFEDYDYSVETDPELNKAGLYGLGATASGLAGASLVKNNWDRLNGTVTRFHNTDRRNVKDILDKGILSKFADDPNNITNRILTDVDAKKKSGLVYTSKNRFNALDVGLQRKRVGSATNMGKTLKLKFNYDDLSKLQRIANPELRGLNKEEFIKDRMKFLKGLGGMFDPLSHLPDWYQKKVLSKMYDQLGNGTHVFKGDISPEHIVGSKKYKSQIDSKRWLEYIKKHPGRFAKGVGLTGAGLAGLAGAGYLAKKSYDAHKEEASKRH